MPSRFSSNYDYSQTFQYLVEQNQANLEAAAARIDAEREAEWAARDSLVFTKWQEGKISGNELMAHINARMRQTGYDKAQQIKWKEAAVQYGNVIADEKAEAAYAESEDISALIAHYSKRLASTKSGTPERRELAERLKSLREKRDTDRIRVQARRIQRQIDRGQMSTKDMIDFYKGQLSQVTDTELRADIKDNIAKLQGKLRQERFEVAMNDIDTRLESGHISPKEAARQKGAVLERYGIANQDPVAFSEWQQHLQQLRATPDPAEIAKLETALMAGTISPEEYSARLRQYADAIAPFDLAGSWELRQEAQNTINELATPLEGGTLLGAANAGDASNRSDGTYSGTIEVVRKLRGNAIKHITQFDGGKYNSTNCGMAAGAMVAHMMGYTGLTGSDLRALSGDTEGGTNVWQAMGAMTNKQVGIPADQLDARSNWSFEEFKQRVAQGAPAVLSGWTGDLPPELNSTSGIMGHGVAIAGYDPKRDAFLVLDPSGRGNQAKAWWPAEVVKSFAWGGQGGFNGIAMLGPTGTIDPKTLDRVGGKVRHISVTAPPERFPNAPRIESPMDPGPARRAQAANESLTKLQKQRLRDAGIIPGKDLDTKQEVSQLLAERDSDIIGLRAVVDEWVDLSQQPGFYDEETNSVRLITNGVTLSGDEIAEIQKRLLFLYDGQEILYEANGDAAKANEMRDMKREVVVDAAIINTMEANFATKRMQREMTANLMRVNAATTPEERARLARAVMEDIGSIAAIADAQAEGEPGTATEDQTAVQRQADAVDAMAVPNEWGAVVDALDEVAKATDSEEAALLLTETLVGLDLYQDNQALLDGLAKLAIEERTIKTGEARYVLADGQLWVATYDEVEKLDPNTGEPYTDYQLDTSNLPEYIRDRMVEQEIGLEDLVPGLVGNDGMEIEVIPQYEHYGGMKFLIGNPRATSDATLKDLDIPDDIRGTILSGAPLSQDQIDTLGREKVERLLGAQALGEAPFYAKKAVYKGEDWWLYEGLAGADPTWHKGKLPFTPLAMGDRDDYIVNNAYVGVSDAAAGAWPDLDGEETDTDTGRLVLSFNVPTKVYDERVREMQMQSRFPSVVNVPDPLNPTNVIELPVENVLVSKFIQPLFGAIESARAKVAARDNAIVTTLPEEQAADVAFWSEQEKEDYAASLGWNPDTETFDIDQPTGDEQAGNQMKALGIKTTQPEQETVQTYDPTKIAQERALGVKKANELERDAKRKAALAERDAAARAAMAAPLPKLTPKLPKPTDTSDYGPRIDKLPKPDGTTSSTASTPSYRPSGGEESAPYVPPTKDTYNPTYTTRGR